MSRRRGKGSGCAYRRGNIWWITYTWRGARKFESSHSPRKTDATELLNQRLGEIGQGKLVGPTARKVTVGEILPLVVEDYEVRRRASLTTIGGHVRAWKESLGVELAVNVNYAVLLRVVKEWQHGGGIEDSTVNRRLAFLQRAYKLAVRAEMLSHVPEFPHLQEHNVRQVTWEWDDYRAVRAELPDDDLRDLLDWLFWTGMRVGQAKKLKWSDYNRQRGELRSPASDVKTGTEEAIPITRTPLEAIIVRRWAARKRHPECPFIFSRNGKRIGSFRKSFTSACLLVGVVAGRLGKMLHDFRRTGVSNLIDSGCDERTAMLVSGHKTQTMLARYNIRRREAVRQALQKVEEFVNRKAADQSDQSSDKARPK